MKEGGGWNREGERRKEKGWKAKTRSKEGNGRKGMERGGKEDIFFTGEERI